MSNMNDSQRLLQNIRRQANKKRALGSARFFKTGVGQYGAGDIFIGLTVPQCRQLAQQFSSLSLPHIKKLLASKVHEERLIALLILVDQFTTGTPSQRRNLFNFYLKHARYVNNWDLVDLSADKIVGEYLQGKSLLLLDKLARSNNLWEKRIAIVSTFAFIKRGIYQPTFRLALLLLNDSHDLIHKAVGWMLREVGKRASLTELKKFLRQHASRMPRTMLRYAIEHLPEQERKNFLKRK